MKNHICVLIILLSLTFATSAIANTNVLFLGDSLSADKDTGIGRNLSLPPELFTLKVAAFCGYSPDNYTSATAQGKRSSPCGTFMRTEAGAVSPRHIVPPLSDLMRFKQGSRIADQVVIQLGTNLYDGLINEKKISIQITAECERLLSAIFKINPNAKILWLAPPKIFKLNGVKVAQVLTDLMFLSIQKAVDHYNEKVEPARVTVVDSRNFTDYPLFGGPAAGDGVHFDSLQTRWLQKTEQSILELNP